MNNWLVFVILEIVTPKKLIVAVLMNMLVIPGSGQVYLKQKKRGMLITLIVAVLLIVFTAHISTMFAELIANVEITTDAFALSQKLSNDLMTKNGFVLKIYLFLLGAVYIFSVVDLVLIYLRNKESPAPHS